MAQAILSLQVAREIEDRHAEKVFGGQDAPVSSAHQASLIRYILGNLPDSFVLIDRDFNVVMGNWKGGKLAVGEATFEGLKCYDIFHKREHPCEDCHIPQILATGEPVLLEKINPHSGGIYEVSAFPILGESGQVTMIAEHLRDITALRKAEKALQESEELYRILTERSLSGVYLIQDNRFLYVNPVLAQILGNSPEEIIGLMSPRDTIHPDDRPLYDEYVRQRLAGEVEETHYIFRGLRRDGTVIFLESLGRRIDYQGRPAIVGTLLDITARKRAETALRESEARYRVLFEISPHSIVLMDLQMKTLMMNPRGLELLGLVSLAEVSGRRGLDDITSEDKPSVIAAIEEMIKTDRFAPLMVDMIKRNGTRVPCLISASLIRDAAGEPRAIIGVSQDISELKRAETALRVSEAKYRELVENASCIILRLDTQGYITFFNKFAQTFFGFPEEEIIGRHVVGTIVPEMDCSGDDLAAKLQDLVKHPEHYYNNENENMRCNGERVWVAWTNKGIYGHDGKLNEVLCIGIDHTEQMGTEKALKESEERFRALFEHAPVGMVTADCNGRFLQTNPAYQAIVGYSAAELQGMTIQQLTHPEDLPGLLRLREEVIAGQRQYYSIEKRNLRKDGEIVWVSVMSARLTNGRNKHRTVATTIDITARKRAEEELAKNHFELQETSRRLEQSRNMLQLIIESIPARVFWKDSNLRYLGCNSLFARDAGFTDPQQLIGNDDFAMGWREQADLYQADDRQVIESRHPKMNYVEPQTTPAGAEIWLKTSKVPLQMQDAEAVGILGVYEDITEFKRAEEALRKSEQRFRLMAETIQDVFWIATSGIEKTTYVSPRFEQVWGRPRQELYQSPQIFLEAIHPEDRERVKSETSVAHDRGEPFNLEYRIIRSDGEVRWIQDRGFPVLNEQGDVILFTGVATDITERKSLEKQLLLAQKMEAVGRLAGGVAHDFNNLLMAISGYGELMRATVLKSDPLYGYLEDILKTTDRAAALTGQLLTFSRQQIVNPQMLDLNLVVLDLEQMLRRLIEEDIELQIITAPGLGAVQADPGYLHQIIMNLVINARDAMPRGGRIVVETAKVDFDTIRQTKSGVAPSGPYVMLLVTDNGVGMDEAIQTHIFEPFFTTKERGKGTGLGLSTVYGIVKQSGGFIDLESVPGEGSTFTVYLPRLGKVEAPAPKKLPKTTKFRGKETILLVEDEDMLRTLLAKFLRFHGYRVLEACHGGEALLTCERHQGPIHIMVTDVVMPQMNGRELMDRLTPLRPEMYVIYMSGYTEDEVVQRGVSELAVAFLQKPFKPVDLVQQVYTILHPPEFG